MIKKFALWVDVWGSHISCWLVDVWSRKMIEETRSRHTVHSSWCSEQILTSWTECVQSSLRHVQEDELLGVGIAVPWPFDYIHGVSQIKGVNKLWMLYGMNIKDKLRKCIHLDQNIPIRFINDACAFGIGEYSSLYRQREAKTISITLGKLFGSSFIKSGIPVLEGE